MYHVDFKLGLLSKYKQERFRAGSRFHSKNIHIVSTFFDSKPVCFMHTHICKQKILKRGASGFLLTNQLLT